MKKLKESRAASFAVVLIVYILAAVIGVAVYQKLTLAWWLALLIADVAATIFVFIFSLVFKNASVYDPYWSVQPPVILVALAIICGVNWFGVLLLLAIGFWATRLTSNWAYTFGNLTHQDWRYTMLHEKTGAWYPIINFIGIHMVPTLVVYGCVLPAAFAIHDKVEGNVGSAILLALSLGAAIMQGIADVEMHKFRKNRDGAFIRRGLWKYSRHPNYLGEILMWWGVGLAVVAAVPSAWYLLAGAVANTVLFLAVSIPMADKRQSKKEGFLQYRRETRMLLPIKRSVK